MAPPKKKQPAEWLELVAQYAKSLRDAGVVKLELEGCTLTLQPLETPVVIQQQAAEPDNEMDPLLDAATYGRTDGRVPGYPRRHRSEDDA